MESIEELRKRRMQNYFADNQSQQQQMAAEQQASEMQAQIKQIMSTLLTKEARERISNIRMIKPDLALQVEVYLIQMFQAGKLRTVLDDAQLKTILDQLIKKKETKIIRK